MCGRECGLHPCHAPPPGTPACNNGSFYCVNRGYEPKRIRSAFVDDGFCGTLFGCPRADRSHTCTTDCCDGSDERTGCQDTCVQQGLAALEALRQQLQSQREGLKARAQYIAGASAIIEGWIKERDALAPTIQSRREEVDRLQGRDARRAATIDVEDTKGMPTHT